MNQTCPQCFSQLASSEVGNLCVNCGYLQRRHHNHAPVQDEDPKDLQEHSNHENTDHTIPGNLEAPRGLDELLFDAPPTNSLNHTSSTELPTSSDIPSEKPRIINHRASSQYRRRLEQQMQTLKTPEIESPLDPDSSLETPNPQDMTSTPTTQSVNEPHATSPTTEVAQEPTDQPDDVIEVHEPHRPSPYLLNMSDAEPEITADKPEYRSPLKTPKTTPPATSTHHSTSQPTPEKPAADVALARADALLAAAASPQKAATASKTNYIIIAVTIILLLGVGSFLAFTLLRKPATQTSPQSSSTNTPTTTQSSSPTPTNLTESAKRDGERKDTLNTIAIALAAYKKANGTYPAGNDIEVLSALTSSNPPYLREIKTDPLSNPESGVVIKYGYNSDGSKFTLTASLENKQDADAVNGLYVVKSP